MKNFFMLVILLLSSSIFAADYSNLKSFSKDEIVTLVGIQQKPELNGRFGRIKNFNEKEKRYVVTLIAQISLDSKPETKTYLFAEKNLQATKYIKIYNPANSTKMPRCAPSITA